MPLLRKLRTALRMANADRRLALEAAAALLAARLRGGLLPFDVVAKQLGGLLAPGTSPPLAPPLSPSQEAAVLAIRWSVAAVSPCMPFKTVCLQQAMAARTMLTRRGIGSVLHLGVGNIAGSKLTAHAWLDAGGFKVTGYPVDPTMHEAGRFI